MALLGCEDGLLGCDAGLSAHCCYYGDVCNPGGPPCPECCTRLDGGEYSQGAITFEVSNEYGTLLVKVIGVGQDRLVCKGDQITVQTEFTPSDLEDPGLPFAVAGWDRLWSYQGHTPPIDEATGYFSRYGVIQWGEEEETDITLSLNYNACFEDRLQQFGDVVVGLSGYDLLVTISFASCPLPFFGGCCDDDVECNPCCWVIPPDVGTRDEVTNDVVFFAEAQGWQLRVANPQREVFCEHEGGELRLSIDVIPPPDVDDKPAVINVNHFRWYAETPEQEEECDKEENFSTDFPVGTMTAFLELFAYDCDSLCPGIPGNVTVTASGEGMPSLSVSFGLDSCDTRLQISDNQREACPCCFERICCDNHCSPLGPPDDICEFQGESGFTSETETKITNFRAFVSADSKVFCPDEDGVPQSFTTEISQSGPSLQQYSCGEECVADEDVLKVSRSCTFRVPVKDDCENASESILIIRTGKRSTVGVGFAGYIWWDNLQPISEIDPCNGLIRRTRTFGFGNITYTYDTSFTVSGMKSCDNIVEEEI